MPLSKLKNIVLKKFEDRTPDNVNVIKFSDNLLGVESLKSKYVPNATVSEQRVRV